VWNEYPADLDQPDVHATPAVAPVEPPGLDPVDLVVDGQRFVVTRRAESAGTYDFDWVTHPASYGFTVGANSEWRPDRAEMIEQIRRFLVEVDPETGYLTD
jgi:hypothetical protein